VDELFGYLGSGRGYKASEWYSAQRSSIQKAGFNRNDESALRGSAIVKFRYRKVPDNTNPKSSWISRPYVDVRLYHGNKYDHVRALIDTGADNSLFHSSIAKNLGIDLKAGRFQEFAGIAAGSTIDVCFHPIQLQIQGFSNGIDYEAGFTESDWVGALLGQSGFFDHYLITFQRYKGRFEIKDRPPAVML